MDHYTQERLMFERQRRLAATAAHHLRDHAAVPRARPARAWVAGRLRAAADRIEGAPRLQAAR